jgi:TolB-like protein
MTSLFSELKRRRVYRVALAYGVFASAMIQVGGTILPIFHAPEWTQQVFVVLIVTGFPFAIVMAWIFDITREGIRRTPNAKGLRVYSQREIWMVATIGVVIAAATLAGYWAWHPWRNAGNAGPPLVVEAASAKSIAVLPFQNLSSNAENAFFADGVQDQILTNLAKVSDLKVISHTSVRQYKSGVARNVREIGQQLGVSYVLEGSVRRAENRVRVSAQLIDARSDSQIWAQDYDGDLADLFGIQSEIAQKIVGQLQAKLSPEQKADIEETPTRDFYALDLYLQAKQIVDTYLEAADPAESLPKALRLLGEATGRDPDFVLAWCYTARAHDLLYFLDLDPTPTRDLLAEAAAVKAHELRPNSAEAHLAMADYQFRVHRDYVKAQKELAFARPGLPNSVPFFNLSGYINRRQGHWAEAKRDFANAVRLDPRNPNAVNLLVDTYVLEREFAAAMQEYDRAIAAGLRTPIALIRRAALDFGANGDLRPLQKALADAPEIDVGGGETSLKMLIARINRDYGEAYRVLAASPRKDFQDVDFSFYFPKPWYEGLIAREQGDRKRAQTAFTAARAILEARLKLKPEDPRTLAVVAQVDANLGRKESAIAEAERAVARMPVESDAYDGPLVLQGLAQVYTWSGEKDRALDILKRLLAMPGYLSYGYLKADPVWEPLRNDPRFKEMLESVAHAQQAL